LEGFLGGKGVVAGNGLGVGTVIGVIIIGLGLDGGLVLSGSPRDLIFGV
jgi:hypothetical protein